MIATAMRIAALVKHVPELDIAPVRLVMDASSRLAVSQAVELAAAVGDGHCTAITMGTDRGGDALREAIAWSQERNVVMDGLLIDDQVFDRADTLATARLLASVLEREGPFDLVLVGRRASDVGTGHVGPTIAELLDLPFATGARYLSMQGARLHVRCEHNDTLVQMTLALPAVVSTAAGLIEPCEMPGKVLAAVDAKWIRTITIADLGPGPWGQDASGAEMRAVESQLPQAPDAVGYGGGGSGAVPVARGVVGAPVAVVDDASRPEHTRAVLGAAAMLAADIGGHVVALVAEPADPVQLGSWGADAVVALAGDLVEEDVARVLAEWATESAPWAVLVAATASGSEIAARAAARLGAGLAGEAIRLEVEADRLVMWRSVYDGTAVVAVTSSSLPMATVRPDVFPLLAPRAAVADLSTRRVERRGRVHVYGRTPAAER